jgi:hypothetical protein
MSLHLIGQQAGLRMIRDRLQLAGALEALCFASLRRAVRAPQGALPT